MCSVIGVMLFFLLIGNALGLDGIDTNPVCRKLQTDDLLLMIDNLEVEAKKCLKEDTLIKMQGGIIDLRKKTRAIDKDTKNKATNANKKTRVRDLIVSISAAIPKLASNDSLTILSGVIDIFAGLGMMAGGTKAFAAAAFGGVFSTIMGLVSGSQMKEGLGGMLDQALNERYDKKLKNQLNGLKDKMNGYKMILDSVRGHEKNFTAPEIRALLVTVNIHQDFMQIGKLQSRIERGAKDSAESQRVSHLIGYLANIAILREAVFIDLMNFLRIANKLPLKIDAIDNVRRLAIGDYQSSLKFLRGDFGPSYLSHYKISSWLHPPHGSFLATNIDQFLSIIGLPKEIDPLMLDSLPHLLVPKAYPEHSLCGGAMDHIKFWLMKGCDIYDNDNSNWKVKFEQDNAGFFRILLHWKQGGPFDSIMSVNEKGIRPGVRTSNPEGYGDREKFRLTPADKEFKEFFISSKKYPNRYLYMGSDPEGEISVSEDPGDQGLWKVI